MKLTGSLVNAYFVCKRKLWFYAHELSPDPNWELLELGRLIAEESYKRDRKELSSEGMKIDIMRRDEGEIVVGEIKKSSKGLKSAIMQLAFYLYRLKQKGIMMEGELLIPKEKKRINVELTSEVEEELEVAFEKMREIMNNNQPPTVEKNRFCNKCAYQYFCWV